MTNYMPDKLATTLKHQCDNFHTLIGFDTEYCPLCEERERTDEKELELQQDIDRLTDERDNLESEIEPFSDILQIKLESMADRIKLERLAQIFHLIDESTINTFENQLKGLKV